jgi:DnaJ-class molecular chaperone
MDFYVVLGVPRTATVADVKRAYRRLARRFHPDVNPGDHVAAMRFKEITEAYETLSDPERRRRYDVLGYQPEPADPAAGFEGFDFSARVHTVQ